MQSLLGFFWSVSGGHFLVNLQTSWDSVGKCQCPLDGACVGVSPARHARSLLHITRAAKKSKPSCVDLPAGCCNAHRQAHKFSTAASSISADRITDGVLSDLLNVMAHTMSKPAGDGAAGDPAVDLTKAATGAPPPAPATPSTVSMSVSSPMSTDSASAAPSPSSVSPPGSVSTRSKRKPSAEGTGSDMNSESTPPPKSSKRGKSKSPKGKDSKPDLTSIDFDDSNTVLGFCIAGAKANEQTPRSDVDQTAFLLSRYACKELKELWPLYSSSPPLGKKKTLVSTLVALIHKRRASMVASASHSSHLQKEP